MIAAAPITTTKAPITVSAFSYSSHRGVIRLSTTLDCWKKSCHGATVVPTMAMTSRSTLAFSPPGRPGTTKSCATRPDAGCATTTSGIISTLTAMSVYIQRSQRRKLPVTVVRPGWGVGGDAAGVVVPHHDDQAGAHDGQQVTQPPAKAGGPVPLVEPDRAERAVDVAHVRGVRHSGAGHGRGRAQCGAPLWDRGRGRSEAEEKRHEGPAELPFRRGA